MRAYQNWKNLSADDFAKTKSLVHWKHNIRQNWRQVQIVNAGVQKKEVEVGFALKVEAEIKLGALKPDDVIVQIFSGPLNTDYHITNQSLDNMTFTGNISADHYMYEGYIPCDESGLFGYSIRIMPYHPDMTDQFGLELMRWIGQTAPPLAHQPLRPEPMSDIKST